MEIEKRLAGIQAKIQNPKNTTENPFYKSKYAPLPEILEMIRPLNAEAGLALVQTPETQVNGGVIMVGVRTFVVSDTGETKDMGWLGIVSQNLDAQKIGAVITYFRRYAVKSIYGIESEDDDGNSAVPDPKKQGKPAEPKAQGNAQSIKDEYNAATTKEAQDAVIAKANNLLWKDVDYQDLAIFFETKLAERKK